MVRADPPPPMAWYGSSFAYYDSQTPTDEELDAAARAHDERLAGFSPEQFGTRPGDGSGVVLGRFLPVHDGHRYIIEFALAHVANLHIFVRVEDGDAVPWPVRRDWLAELFPGVPVTAIEGEPWDQQILARITPDLVFTGELYGVELAQRLGAQHVAIDRRAIPISGTDVRAEPWAFERYLPPPVRAWYARRVCVMGPEHTGKTSLAKRLAEHYGTLWVPERLRTFNVELRAPDLAFAAYGQQVAEDLLARRATRVLFTDTGPLSVRLWTERLFGTAPDWLREATERGGADLYLLTAPDLPFVGPDARNTPAERRAFFDTCKRELDRLGHRYVTIEGDGDRAIPAIEAVDALLAT